jgi:hypothetical protein
MPYSSRFIYLNRIIYITGNSPPSINYPFLQVPAIAEKNMDG